MVAFNFTASYLLINLNFIAAFQYDSAAGLESQFIFDITA